MLNPRDNRLDYGVLLAPPAGYQLEFAVGTTYSLDLNALTTAIFALGSGEAMDSALKDNPICLLEAMLKIADKVALFCQQGQIHIPRKVSKLHPLLDRCVFPVHMENGCSFHPKCWLLHYTPIQKDKLAQEDKKEEQDNQDNQDKYRFIVLSRNLTWDRSWDMAFSMDGASGMSDGKNAPLKAFLQWLRQSQNMYCEEKEKTKKLQLFDELTAKLDSVVFQIQNQLKSDDRPIEDFEFLPVGVEGVEGIQETALFKEKYDELLVMSPFLSKTVVKALLKLRNGSGSKAVLFTRKTALPDTKDMQKPWNDVYVLKDTAIYGEGALSKESPDLAGENGASVGETKSEVCAGQDIHAKLYMHKIGRKTTLYLGSLNATMNAVAGNVEFMIELKIRKHWMNLKSLLKALCCGEPGNKDSPFEKVFFDQLPEQETSSGEDESRLIKQVLDLGLRADAVMEEGGLYRQQISYARPKKLQALDGWIVTVRPLQASESSAVRLTEDSSALSFLLPRTALSEFFVLTIRKDAEDPEEQVISRVIVIPTTGIPEAERQKDVIKSIISTKDNFYQYVAYLLGDDKMLGALEAGILSDEESIDEHADSNMKVPKVSGLYEKMLKTAATTPGRIERIKDLTDAIQDNEVIPKEFGKLYEVFHEAVKDHG